MNTQAKIRTYETNNNYYCVARISKTTYEEQQVQKAYRKFVIQKLLIILGLVTACIVFSLLSVELIIPMIITGLLGIIAVLTNNL